jgi:hypothetical protein
MSKRFKDFSAAKEGVNKEPIVIGVDGEEFTFPPFLTAETVLTQLTWLEEDGSIAAPNLPKWFVAIMGQDNFDKISAKVDLPTLQEISQHLMSEYGMTPEDLNAVPVEDEDEGDSPK